jgi:hypothetical protein
VQQPCVLGPVGEELSPQPEGAGARPSRAGGVQNGTSSHGAPPRGTRPRWRLGTGGRSCAGARSRRGGCSVRDRAPTTPPRRRRSAPGDDITVPRSVEPAGVGHEDRAQRGAAGRGLGEAGRVAVRSGRARFVRGMDVEARSAWTCGVRPRGGRSNERALPGLRVRPTRSVASPALDAAGAAGGGVSDAPSAVTGAQIGRRSCGGHLSGARATTTAFAWARTSSSRVRGRTPCVLAIGRRRPRGRRRRARRAARPGWETGRPADFVPTFAVWRIGATNVVWVPADTVVH